MDVRYAAPVGVRDLWDRVVVLKAGISIPGPSAMLACICQAFDLLQSWLKACVCWRAFARLWFGLQARVGPPVRFLWAFGTFGTPRGCGEGGYLDSRTLGDAGVHWPGFFDLQSWLKA